MKDEGVLRVPLFTCVHVYLFTKVRMIMITPITTTTIWAMRFDLGNQRPSSASMGLGKIYGINARINKIIIGTSTPHKNGSPHLSIC